MTRCNDCGVPRMAEDDVVQWRCATCRAKMLARQKIKEVDVRGYFAIGIERVKTERNVGSLWRTAHLLGAQYIFTIGRRYKKQASDTTKAWKSIPLFHHLTFDDFYAQMPHDCRLVGVELDARSKPLETYAHPARCIYILGAEDHGLTGAMKNRCHDLVQLPGWSCMNVAVAGSCVLYDRVAKAKRAA